MCELYIAHDMFNRDSKEAVAMNYDVSPLDLEMRTYKIAPLHGMKTFQVGWYPYKRVH